MESSTNPARPRPARRVLAVGATGLLVGLVATGSISVDRSGAGRQSDLRTCTWRPMADEVAGTPDGLLGTIRLNAGRVEVLHRVSCSDGSSRDAWMASP